MRVKRGGWIFVLLLSFVASGFAQNFGNPFDMPMVRKYWNPIVGAGAVYQVTDADGAKRIEEYEILSEETVEGNKAYWLEVAGQMPQMKGEVYVKMRVIPEFFEAGNLIVQLPGKAAMEMPVDPVPKAMSQDLKDGSKLVGTETITVPGGTFECERWRNLDNSDVWLSSKVGPIKIVKTMGGPGEKRVLIKTISHAQDGITGPVRPFDPEAIKKFSESLSQK
jgi:hypothetical protein